MDVAFVLDMSGSTEAHHFTTMDLAREIVYGIDLGYSTSDQGSKVGLISYGNYSQIRFKLNTYSTKDVSTM